MMHYHCRICSHAFDSMHALCPDCNSSQVEAISSIYTSSSQQSIIDLTFLNNLPKFAADISLNLEVLFRQEIEHANYTFVTNLKFKVGEVDCAICIENVSYGIITFFCGHSFHALCAFKWLSCKIHVRSADLYYLKFD